VEKWSLDDEEKKEKKNKGRGNPIPFILFFEGISNEHFDLWFGNGCVGYQSM